MYNSYIIFVVQVSRFQNNNYAVRSGLFIHFSTPTRDLISYNNIKFDKIYIIIYVVNYIILMLSFCGVF